MRPWWPEVEEDLDPHDAESFSSNGWPRGSSERARGSRSGFGAGAGVVGAGQGSLKIFSNYFFDSNGAPHSGAPLVTFFFIISCCI